MEGYSSEKGNQCEVLTMYKSLNQSEPGICLNLPFISSNHSYLNARHKYYKILGVIWEIIVSAKVFHLLGANSFLEKSFLNSEIGFGVFMLRKQYVIMTYLVMIYIILSGVRFYRNCRFAKELSKRNKPIICTYHGQDMRTRGVIKELDQISNLNLTSELDLLSKHPNIEYLFLPYNTEHYDINVSVSDQIKCVTVLLTDTIKAVRI